MIVRTGHATTAVSASRRPVNRAFLGASNYYVAMVIDLAGTTGGNVEPSKADEVVERTGVTIIAPTNLPATVPVHASQLYSRNVTAFLSLLIKDGELNVDMNDDVVGPSCVTHEGKWVNSRVAAAVEKIAVG